MSLHRLKVMWTMNLLILDLGSCLHRDRNTKWRLVLCENNSSLFVSEGITVDSWERMGCPTQRSTHELAKKLVSAIISCLSLDTQALLHSNLLGNCFWELYDSWIWSSKYKYLSWVRTPIQNCIFPALNCQCPMPSTSLSSSHHLSRISLTGNFSI